MINALKYVKQLEDAGYTREQAETHVQVVSEIIQGDLATKKDLLEVKIELRQEIQRLDYKIDSVEQRLVINLGIMMATMITISTAIFALIVKLH